VWFGGGKLSPDLSLPQLQARWSPSGTEHEPAGTARPGRTGQPAEALSVLDRRRLWLSAQQAIGRADEQIRGASNPLASADAQAGAQAAAAAAGEVLSAVGWLVERKRGGPLRQAADGYDRAARDLRRRTVPATPHSHTVRRAAAGLLSARLVKQSETRQLLALLGQLSDLADTLARLRAAQGRAAQAQAARRAAEQLSAEQARRATATAAATVSSGLGGPVSGLPVPPPHRAASRPTPRPPSASR